MVYQIQENCVACMKCKAECPAEAIYLTANCLKIDADLCIGCGLCSRICKESAVVSEEELSQGESLPGANPKEKKEVSCDVLVLGGGGAGMVAAARIAKTSDLKVIVVEKEAKTGGGAWYAADFKIFGSKWQKDREIPDRTEEELQKAMDATYWRLSPKLARECYESTGKFFDWLCESGEGVEDEFKEGFYIFDGPMGPHIPVFKKMRHGRQGGTGQFVVDQMLALCEESGVRILTNTSLQSLEREGDRVVAAHLSGNECEYYVNCKEVVLATGSWIENQKLLERVDSKFAAMRKVRSPHRSPAYTGEGITAMEEIGVPIDYDSMCLRLMGPLFMASDGCPYPSFQAMNFDTAPIWVNQRGERWVNESFGSRAGVFAQAIPLREQPGGISYLVFDSSCIENALEKAKSGQSMPTAFPVPQVTENWREELEAANAEYGYAFFMADSLEELAERCGFNKKNFLDTVERYNGHCQAGFDPDYAKTKDALIALEKAPFFALKQEMATDGAFGGIPIADSLQVKLSDHELLENVYAAGDLTNGRYINQGGIKVQIINDLAWAFASGFMAAEHIKAKY